MTRGREVCGLVFVLKFLKCNAQESYLPSYVLRTCVSFFSLIDNDCFLSSTIGLLKIISCIFFFFCTVSYSNMSVTK